MNRFTVKETKSSPSMDFDPDSGVFEINGESYPENCSRLYGPMFDWLKDFFNNYRNKEIRFNFEILYFNSSTSKTFMDLFDLLDEEAGKGRNIKVNWFYHDENETALECGEEFKEDVSNLKFELVCLD